MLRHLLRSYPLTLAYLAGMVVLMVIVLLASAGFVRTPYLLNCASVEVI